MKKIVAITQRIIEESQYHEIREALDMKYIELLNDLEYTPCILSSNSDFREYFSHMPIEGLILTGGNDLYCCNQNPHSFKRDDFEKELIVYCIDKKIPILGICRGMQILADHFGSSFIPVKNQVNIKHTLKVSGDSKYSHFLKQLSIVNSYHNFGIDSLSSEFLVSAISEDNIIKAIEHKELRIFAHMWHPERNMPFNKSELDLIKSFFESEEIIR